jgi:hypothetical protein
MRKAVLATLAFLPIAPGQQPVTCQNGKCTRVIYGTAPAAPRLRVNAHGPVTLEAGNARALTYSVKVTVSARTEAEARRVLQQYAVRMDHQGGWAVLTAPGGAATSTVSIQSPHLSQAIVSTTDGVKAFGVDGPLDVNTLAGELTVDRVQGDVKLQTGGGDVHVGRVGGALHCVTGAGHITVKSAQGEAILETSGGDIVAGNLGGVVRAQTGGGGVRIASAGGAVTAISGGGEIVVEKAAGVVTLRNMAGPVQVGSAAGVRCESGSGGIRLSNITGAMRVSTSMGNILASLGGSRLNDSYLATGSGDITVLIPSNVGVSILAENSMADTLRRIVSEYPAIQTRRQGTRVIAEGSINGGGPLLQISGTGGTIYIKRQ